MSTRLSSILLIDEDTPWSRDLRLNLEKSGHDARLATTVAVAGELLDETPVDVIVASSQILDADLAGWGRLRDDADESELVLLLDTAAPLCAERVGERLMGAYVRSFATAAITGLVACVDRRLDMVLENRRLRREIESGRLDWSATVDAIQDPIVVVDSDGEVICANRSFALRFGSSSAEVIGARDVDLLYGDVDKDPLQDLRVGFLTYETSELAIPGTFLVSHYPIQLDRGTCVVYHLTDISARKDAEDALKRSEAQLRQAQKMEAIGRLAGGVAHDFNNLLTTVIGYSELLLLGIAEGTREHDAVSQINRAAQRGAGLTKQLLSFSRSQVLRPEVIDVNALLGDMTKMLRRLIGADIELVFVHEPELGLVRSDRGQLEQVVMNLVVNSRDAMPRGGTLTLQTANAEHVPHAASDGAARPYVVLSVTDTGEGMDETTQSHAFEPFFTTKDEGTGTGLGLSIVYAIVKQHGGDIEVQSALGRGTTIELLLPLVAEQLALVPSHDTTTRSLSGSDTVLLVEDEESVRQVVRGILERYGYRVIDAASAAQALAIARELDWRFDILLTDLVMPEMNGSELIQQMRTDYPDVKVLMMSGYAPSSDRYRTAVSSETPFISKPFRPAVLVQMLRDVLDGNLTVSSD